MKVYFSASSSGSDSSDRENYLKVLQIIRSFGHSITNPYYATMVEIQEGCQITKKKSVENDDVFEILRKKILVSNCVVAEISTPSISLGIQLEYALSNKIPVMCIFKADSNADLPLMVRDYKNPLLFKQPYTLKNIYSILENFFKNVPRTKIKFNMYITYELDKFLSRLSKRDHVPKAEVIRSLIQDKIKADKGYRI